MNIQMFQGYEDRDIIKEVSTLLKLITKIRTYRINGELTNLQRKILDLSNVLEIPNEFININTWEEKWLWLKQS